MGTMPTAASILTELKSKGSEKYRSTLSRHGMPADRIIGVSVAELKLIAKKIKGQQSLACELYQSGLLEAMYLAGMVADGSQMTKTQLNAWAEGAAGLPMIFEYTVPWVTIENPHARDLAIKWIDAKTKEHIAAAGWCSYSGLVATRADDNLDLAEIKDLCNVVVKGIGNAPNRVRSTMNGFLIAVGTYVTPLLSHAKSSAQKIGQISVDKGDTACKVPLATAYIEKVEAAGRVGRKRKTIRC
jgi:3-methyladenine DNA glycosylase AlkD